MRGQVNFKKLVVLSFLAGAVGLATPVEAGPLARGAAVSSSLEYAAPFSAHDGFLIPINDENGNPGKGAERFVSSMGERAIGFLSDSSLTAEQKKASFRKLLQDSFDMKTIGRFSLGRYWRVSTPEQRKEYQALFESMVINIYSQRFADYQGQKFETRTFRIDGPSDVIVTSFIVPETGPEIQVDWRIRNKNGNYRVIDVIVEGVSMSVTQRSDFASVIQRGGGDVGVLLSHLRGQ